MFRDENKIFYEFLTGNFNFVSCMTQESAIFLTELMSGKYGTPTLLPFESPDILLLFDDRTIMIEHFRFDSSEYRKGGSLLQEEKRKFEQNSSSDTFNIKKIRNESSIKFYSENVISTFKKHIVKHSKYLENVSKKKAATFNGIYKEINQSNKSFGIVTHDVSIDYNMFRNDKGEMEYLSPFHLKEYRELLKQHSEVEHVFHIVKTSQEQKWMYYFHNVKEELEKLDKIMNYASPSKIEEADVYYWINNSKTN